MKVHSPGTPHIHWNTSSSTPINFVIILFGLLYSLHVVTPKVGPPTLTKAAKSGRPALTVTWTAPQSDYSIIKYQIQYRRSDATSWSTKDVTSTSTTLKNLTAGTSYQVQVRAISDIGAGPYSDMRTQITHRGMNVTTAFDVFRSGVNVEKG